MSGTQQRAELHKTIWALANELRGSVDGWDFKQYVLGTLFYIAFGSIFKNYASEPIKTAVVYEMENKEGRNQIMDFLTNLETDGRKLLDIEVMDMEKAEKLLDDEDVNGIIIIKDDGKLLLKAKTNGNQTSVQESIVTAYNQSVDLIEKVEEEHPEKLMDVLANVSERVTYINQKDMAGDNKDPYVAYFYNLMVMTALFGSMNSLRIGNNCQANMSALGARTNASPLKRSVLHRTDSYRIYSACLFDLWT